MSLGHVCVSLLWLGCVFGGSGILLAYVYKADADFAAVDACIIRKLWLLCSGITGCFLLVYISERTGVVLIAYGLLGIYLISCSVMDVVLKMICDFFHGIGMIGGCISLFWGQPEAEVLVALLSYVGIQWLIFRKMYGLADMAAYVICAMYLVAEGRGLLDCLLHMLLTFLLLGLVQGGKRNISATGNLKHPVALLPYIAMAFFLII